MEREKNVKPCLTLGRKSPKDKNVYKFMQLKNGIEVLFVQNNEFKNSSCALAVNVGSFDDPMKYPGMAHFLEHMLFMGTDKYPGENEFDGFLAEHNGYSNAHTENDKTVYYCNVDSKEYSKMVEMFASFFICPIFRQSSVKNEMMAVDSEFLCSYNVQEWRVQRLRGELSEDMKRGRFSCGNMQTLEKKGIMEAIKKFWRDEYSSELMTVVMCSNESIETMVELAKNFELIESKKSGMKNSFKNFFADKFVVDDHKLLVDLEDVPDVDNKMKLEIDNRINPAANVNSIIDTAANVNSIKDTVASVNSIIEADNVNNSLNVEDPVNKEIEVYNRRNKANGHIVWMKHVCNGNELNLSVILPPLLHLFKYKVLEYIKYELTSEACGSLMSFYKDNGLAFSISSQEEHYVDHTNLIVTIGLTKKGRDEHKKVLDMFYGWLDMFKPRKCVWEWMRRMEVENFQLGSGGKASEICPLLCEELMMYPAANLLNHVHIYEKYDEALITYFIKILRDPTRWLIILALNNNFDSDCVESFYSIEYKIGELYEKRSYAIKMQACQCTGNCTGNSASCSVKPCVLYSNDIVRSYSMLSNDLKAQNLYFSCFNSFELVPKENSFFSEDTSGKCLFVFEEQFGLPRAKCFFRLESPSLKNEFARNDVFLRLALDAFEEKYYDEMQCHQLNVTAELSIYMGILLTFEGLSQHIPAAVASFFAMLESVDTRRFSVIRQNACDEYNEHVASPPYHRLCRVFFLSLVPGCPTIEQCILDIEGLSVDDIAPPHGCSLDMTIVGNISQSVVKDIYTIVSASSIVTKLNDVKENSKVSEASNERVLGEVTNGSKTTDVNGIKENNEPYISKTCTSEVCLSRNITRCFDVNYEYTFTTTDLNNNAVGLFFSTVSFNYTTCISDISIVSQTTVKNNQRVNEKIRDKTDDDIHINKLKLYAIGALFHQIAQNEFFDQLRTKEQLGYVVRCLLRFINNTHFITFEVQSTKATDFLEQRIKTFVHWLLDYIAQMDIDQFETHKQSLIDTYTEPFFNLDELQANVVFCDFAFKHDIEAKKKLVSIVKMLEKTDLLQSQIFNNYIKVYSVKNEN